MSIDVFIVRGILFCGPISKCSLVQFETSLVAVTERWQTDSSGCELSLAHCRQPR